MKSFIFLIMAFILLSGGRVMPEPESKIERIEIKAVADTFLNSTKKLEDKLNLLIHEKSRNTD